MSEIVRRWDRFEPAIPETSHGPCHDYAAVASTPWSEVKLGICASDEVIAAVDFLPGAALEQAAANPLAAEAVRQLQDYFRTPLRGFALPLMPRGTAFQQRVWQALLQIPCGSTRSYGALAGLLGSSARAVGGACRANPIPIIIPCHRVVAKEGLGGFMGVTAGHGLRIKQYLLAHETPV